MICLLRIWTSRPRIKLDVGWSASTIIALALSPINATSQTLRGTVVDDQTSGVIAGAVVTVATDARNSVQAITNEAGRFQLDVSNFALPAMLMIRVSHISYDSTAEARFQLTSDIQNPEVELRVTPAAIPLPSLTVSVAGRTPYLDRVGFYHRQSMGRGTLLDREAIEAKRPVWTHQIFRGVRGIKLTRTRRGQEPVVSRPRGFGQDLCPAVVYIDGLKIDRMLGFEGGGGGIGDDSRDEPVRGAVAFQTLNSVIDPGDIEAIEIYRGPAETPQQYADGAVCGVYVIWTRR